MGSIISWPFALAKRAVRHLLVERSYERYYSAAGWDTTYVDGYILDSDDQDVRYGSLLALMQRYDHGEAILDVGCGEGLLEQKFRQLSSSRMVGIDYSQQAINLARAKNIARCEFICTDYRNCALQDEFAIIVFNESLYYVEDFVGALGELSERLAPGGVLIISMFERLVTRRIWKAILPHYSTVRSIRIGDETYGRRWRIRVLHPRGSGINC